MKIVFTQRSIDSFEEIIDFLILERKVPKSKAEQIKDAILNHNNVLETQPFIGQIEPYLIELNGNHRRIILKNIKVIYQVIEEYIYITDIFDTRQDPKKMKG